MNIEYIPHAVIQMLLRGVTESEVAEVLVTGELFEGHGGRWIRQKVLTSGYGWNGRHCPHKEVSVVYEERPDSLAVITVKTRYGFWEGLE